MHFYLCFLFSNIKMGKVGSKYHLSCCLGVTEFLRLLSASISASCCFPAGSSSTGYLLSCGRGGVLWGPWQQPLPTYRSWKCTSRQQSGANIWRLHSVHIWCLFWKHQALCPVRMEPALVTARAHGTDQPGRGSCPWSRASRNYIHTLQAKTSWVAHAGTASSPNCQ